MAIHESDPPSDLDKKLNATLPAVEFSTDRLENNYYLAPGFNPVSLHEEMIEKIEGSGGDFDQVFGYLDTPSAVAWLNMTSSESYIPAQAIPLVEVANVIKRKLAHSHYEPTSLDLLSLGCGDARQERRLIEIFLAQTQIKSIHCYLLDVNNALLTIATREAKKLLTEMNYNVKVTPVQGNFHHLRRYKALVNPAPSSRRIFLVTMLGYTFSNLENEILFLRNSLGALPEGTLFFVDIVLGFAPSNQPEEIKKLDPWLTGQTQWKSVAEKLWAIPFLQHRKDIAEAKNIRFIPTLDNRSCCIEGSYVVEIRAIIGNDEFTVQRLKRYAPDPFIKAFEKEGWRLISTFPFYENRRLACLFQKTSSSPSKV